MTKPLKSFSIEELTAALKEAGLPSFRAQQILDWTYVKGVASYSEMSNVSKPMREQLAETYPLFVPAIIDKQTSVDGSRKYLLEFHDGIAVEAVGLPSEDSRLTVCCSSQAGCGMACSFCATGRAGLIRNLDPGEIVDQVIAVQRD